MPRFLACSACHRHVRADATRCPFCSFGPLHCTARPPAGWLLTLSVAASSLGLLGCDDEAKHPTHKVETTTSDPSQKAGADEPGQTTKAEPEPDPEPEVDIYGGPRMMEDAEPEEPQPTIYGGPRMGDPEPLPPQPEPE